MAPLRPSFHRSRPKAGRTAFVSKEIPVAYSASRTLLLMLGLTLFLVATASAARAASIFRVTSDRLTFYNNLYVMTGYGNVRIDLRNGSKIAADSFVIDLRLNRFVVSGNVRITTLQKTYEGAALSADLENGTSYFVSLDGTPERLTFRDDRFTNAESGGEAAADAFAFPDLKNSPASLIGTKVTIGAGEYIRFDGCRTQILGGYKYYFPLPICYINFGSDPNLAQDALNGASVGAQYKFAGNANSTSSLLLNYDTVNKVYGALEQNLSSPNGWAVVALNSSNDSRIISGIAYAQPAENLGVRASSQLHFLSPDATNDLNWFSYSDAEVTQGLPYSYLQLNYSFANEASQGPGPGFDIGAYDPTHPSSIQLGLRSSDLRLGPAAFNLAGGYGQTHDPYGLQTFGGVTYTTLWFDYLDAALFAPSLKFGSRSDPGNLLSLDLLATDQREWYSLPHYTNWTTTSATLTKSFSGKATLSLGYGVENVADIYPGAQRQAYPSFAPPQGPGYAAFEGLATFRTLSLGATYTPSARLSLAATLSQHTDFPAPIPNFFALAPQPVLGINPYPNYLGQPPYQLYAGARIRINDQLSLDFQNTYFFNYQGADWSGLIFAVRP